MWIDDVNTTYLYAFNDFTKCCENRLYTFIYSPHCMRVFNYQKISWKFAKVVVNGPKVISCYQNKTENRRKNKLTLRNEDIMCPSKIVYLSGISCYRNSQISPAYLLGSFLVTVFSTSHEMDFLQKLWNGRDAFEKARKFYVLKEVISKRFNKYIKSTEVW